MKKSLWMCGIAIAYLAFSNLILTKAQAGDLACEVMSVSGDVNLLKEDGSRTPLKEGDLLTENAVIETREGAADLSFDRDWSNVIRIESGSKIKVASLWPSKVDLQQGAVYAKLKKLPKQSTFEIQTPTAVAAVRGTEYRALYKDAETQVFNFSASEVYVSGIDALGNKFGDPMTLSQSQKTQIAKVGEPPKTPVSMSVSELDEGRKVQKILEDNLKKVSESGRKGKIQTVGNLEAMKLPSDARNPKGESRVNDTRRRSFRAA